MKSETTVTIRVEREGELVEVKRDDTHASVALVRALAWVADRLDDDKLERLAEATRLVMEREYGWTVSDRRKPLPPVQVA